MGDCVLFVDDEPNILRALRREFRAWAEAAGYELLSAETGEKALELLASHPDVVLVVSDYRMPGMNGSQLLGIVAERFPEAGRVMLTGYSDDDEVRAALKTGEGGYVKKPWKTEVLAAAMERAITGARG